MLTVKQKVSMYPKNLALKLKTDVCDFTVLEDNIKQFFISSNLRQNQDNTGEINLG